MSILNSNKMNKATSIVESLNGNDVNVKRVKKDRGLIERTEDKRIIIAEDNRQVIFG